MCGRFMWAVRRANKIVVGKIERYAKLFEFIRKVVYIRLSCLPFLVGFLGYFLAVFVGARIKEDFRTLQS